MKKIFFIFFFMIQLLNSKAQQTVGLFTQDSSSLAGYILFAPLVSPKTYLIDKCGYLVHTWISEYSPGLAVYLLPDGTLLRAGSIGNSIFNSGGNGGIIERFDWNSNRLWSYKISSDTTCQHHDVRQLPNGNILAIVWELKTKAQAVAAGRDSANIPGGTTMWFEKIVEIQPSGSNGGTIVWEWHAFDHLIQDYDSAKDNYGTVSQHPELLNVNFNGPVFNQANIADWLHCNALDYNSTLDQIILNSHNLSEVWIIDHSTTTAEAASHTGGTHGKGGDFLYRWGNPAAYNRGTSADQKLFGDHNPHWIDSGLTGAGNILVYNNGWYRPAGNYSSVEIFAPPVDSSGNYSITQNQAYQPDSSYWIYTAPNLISFYSQVISGAQRLSNGNTLIDEGTPGTFFEIDTSKNTVWEYINPVGTTITKQGKAPVENSVFRCTLYEPSYPGFAGQTLTPGSPIELDPLSYNCTMITGIDEFDVIANPSLLVINPFFDQLIISANTDLINATATLMDMAGRVIDKFENVNLITNAYSSFKLQTNIPPGIYLLNLKSSKQSITAKLIHIE